MSVIKQTILRYGLIFLILSIIFLFFSCAHNRDWAERLDWKEVEFEKLPGENEYPDAGAIIILDQFAIAVKPI